MTDKKLLDRLASLSPEQREALLKQLQKKKSQGAEPRKDAIQRYARDTNRLAMSYAQQRLWFIDQLQSGSASYNISAALRLTGPLDVEALRMSFDEIVLRHEVLRTIFVTDDGQGRQVINEHQRWELPTISLDTLSSREQEEVINTRYKGDSLTSFDLINGPLLRTRLIRLSNIEHVIIVTMHHIISDGWSMGVFIREMALLYDAFRQDKASPLKPLPIQYADYSLWQREWLSGERLERQLSYWKTRLDGVTVLELPTDFARPPVHTFKGNNIHFSLDPRLTQQLNELSKKQGVTLFMTLFATLQTLLHRYSGQDDICIGTPIAGRVRPEVESLIGCFVNTLAIRSDLQGNPSFLTLLKQVQQNLTGAYDHQDIPFERLVDELGMAREMSHTPLFQVMFVLQNATAGSAMSLPELDIEVMPAQSETSKFDITINLREEKGCIKGDWEYRTDLFSEHTIQRMSAHFQNLLAVFMNDPTTRVDDAEYLLAQEKQQLLYDWNATGSDYERESDVLDLFAHIVSQNKDKIAVQKGDERVTYLQLDSMSNHIALALQEKQVLTGQRVGVCADRSIETIAAILGILKAGAAYVPLDPAYPVERLQYMIEDSQASVIVAHRHLADSLPSAESSILLLDGFRTTVEPISGLDLRVGPKASAYVMYTSGSTGKPKGIDVVHRNIVRLVRKTNFMKLDATTCFLQYAPISFDAATLEIWGPLLNGGRIAVAPPGNLNAEEYGSVVKQNAVNTAWLTAALFHYFVEYHLDIFKPLKQLLAGGDVLSPKLVRNVLDEYPHLTLINGYGPTENTTFTCCYPMQKVGQVRATVPIGKPVANTKVFVLDKNRKPVAVGIPGELYTSGDGVANGYLNRDELTTDVFVPNPFQSDDDPVLYKTGDLVRYYADGNLEYLGRIDQQVKIRGFRIELSEVEDAVSKINTIREVAVIAREDVPRVKRLVAYYVPVKGVQPTSVELRSELKQSLPEYMIPSVFVGMETLPMTANGKLDRRALPKPETDNDSALQRVPPRTEKEIILADIWAQVLNLEEIGIRDNFFEMGGDSILSIQIISRAKLAGLHLTTKQVFENQTIEELALVASEAESPILAEQGEVTGEAVLSPIQQWFFDHQFVNEQHWNQSVLLNIKADSEVLFQHLSSALTALVAQHDALRLRFTKKDHVTVQTFTDCAKSDDNGNFRVSEFDLSHVPADQLSAQITDYCNQVQASLDLQSGPLLAAALIKLPNQEFRLLLVLHHLVVDGVSWRILLEDFNLALDQLHARKEVALGYKTTSYKQWVEALRDSVELGHLNGEFDYWCEITGQDKPKLPFDAESLDTAPRDSAEPNISTHSIWLSESFTQSLLRDVNRAYRTEINDILLTALSRTVSDWSGNVDTLLDLEGHGREIFSEKIDLSRTVGWFTSVYPVRLRYENGRSIQDNLRSVKEQLRHIPGRGFGFGALRYLGTEVQQQALADAPKADIVFNYLGQFNSILEGSQRFTLASEQRGREHSPLSEDPHPLSINSHIVGDKLQIDWIYSAEFSAETITKLARQYVAALEQIIDHCTQPGVFGYTPSDFPLARLDQSQLDRLLGVERNIESMYPLSPMQEGMLFHSLFDNDHGVYFEQLSVEVLGSADRELLKKAWVRVVNRHPALRSSFVWQEIDRPLQIVYNQVEMEISEVDWRHIDTSLESTRLDAWLEKDRQRGFDFEKPGLMRLAWLELPGNRSRLIWSFHHIVLDGWSLPLVMGEVFQTYGMLVKGEDPVLPPAGSYGEFISYLEQVDKGDALQFWKLYLSEFEAATPLPNKKAVVGSTEKIFLEQVLKLSENFSGRLQQFARDQHVTLNTVIQAAWGVLLARYSSENDVVFGTTVSGRPADLPNVENIVGLFINTLPLRISLDDDTTIAPLLQRMQEDQVDLRRFEFTPLVDIHRYSEVPGDQSLFESILVFENYPVGDAVHQADELINFGHITTIEHTNFPITLIVEPADQLAIKLSYDSGLFDYPVIARILEHLRTLLHSMLSQPDVPLLKVPMLSEDERNNVLRKWNPAPANYPRNLCIHQIFERHVKAHPDRVAMIAGDEQLTYEQLNAKANQLARYLLEVGVNDGDFVAIALQRSVDMIICILATLKVGAAYVPVDPDYPEERIGFMLSDTQSPLVICRKKQADRLASIVEHLEQDVQILVLEDEQPRIGEKSKENPLTHFTTNSKRYAYVIYTSGSTGKPKGVLVHQLSVIRLVLDSNYFTLANSDRVCHTSNVSFDAAIYDVWAPLLNGAGMVLFTKEQLLNPELFYKEVNRTGANVSFITTALLNMYVATEPKIFANFKYVFTGGEAHDPNVIRKILSQHKPQHFFNVYGPTENTTFSTFYELTQLPENVTNVPIGRSISGSTCYVLDRNLQPVPVGVQGEIYVGGDGVAVGYLNDPERTANSFLPDPFSGNTNQRLYKTGDIARYNEDGYIEILGRADDQVKIRGFRIELSEVEANLTRIDGVTDAIVVVKDDNSNQKRLVAYIKTNADLDATRVRQHAPDYLPKHMIPASFVVLEQFPLTSNGKVDKRALPEPVFENKTSYQYVAPRTDNEIKLVDIWEQVLKADTVGIHDNFFELGGDSILSIQIISRAKRAGLHLTAKQIFDFQTIAELADVAREVQDLIIAEQGLVEGDIPLTPIQHWYFESQPVDPHHFNQSLLLQVDSKVSLEHLTGSLEAVLLHHDALRLRFKHGVNGWQQSFGYVEHSGKLINDVFEVVNLSGLPQNLRSEQIEHLSDKAQRELNLSSGPPVKAVYFDLGDQDPARLLLVINHLAVDVFSWRILLEDLQTGLAQTMRGARIDFGAKTTSYQQWSNRLMEFANSRDIEADAAFWSHHSATFESNSLPTDKSGANTVASVAIEKCVLDKPLTQKLLKESGRAYRTEINDLLLTALQRTFSQWSAAERVLVDLEGHGREHISDNIDVSRTVGWFTTVFPVVLTGDSNIDLGNNICSVKEYLRQIPRKGMTYGVLRYLNDVHSAANPVKSEISFNYLGQLDQVLPADALLAVAAESSGSELSPHATRSYLFEVSASVQNDELVFNWRYSSNLHEASTVHMLAQTCLQELQQIIEHCSGGEYSGYTPSDFPLLELSQPQINELLPSSVVETVLPLSPTQEGMLFHALYEPGSWVYFDQIIVPISGDVNESALFDAWRKVVARHQILRAGFIWEGVSKPIQVIMEQVELDIHRYDWSRFSQQEANEKVDRLLIDDRNMGFNFRRPNVMRLSWIVLPEGNFKLVWSFHHILLDGWSMPVVFGELFTIYEDLVKQRETQLHQPARYQDFIAWISRQDNDKAGQFWHKYLSGFTATTPIAVKNSFAVAQHNADNPATEGQYQEQSVMISGRLLEGLQSLAKQHRLTLNNIMQGVWAILLRRYSGESDVLFGTTVSGRPAELQGIESMVGLFINTLPMRMRVADDQSFIDWLQEEQVQQSEIKNYEYSSLVEIQKQSELTAKQALFESILVFENYPIDESLEETQASLSVGSVGAFQQTNFPLTIIFIPGKEMELRVSYDGYLFEADTIGRMMGHVERLLQCIEAEPDIQIGQLPLITEAEQQQLVYDWNRTERVFAFERTVSEHFEAHVQARPDMMACEFGDKKVTYEKLNRRVNRLAHQLLDDGIQRGDLVAVCLDRSMEMIEAILAVLKVGAAYVPIDTSYPDDRVEYMLAETQAPIFIVAEKFLDHYDYVKQRTLSRLIGMQALKENARIQSTENLNIRCENGSQATACIIFTSGTTGKPKGVCIPQIGLSRLVLNPNYMDLSPGHRMAHAANVSFDAASFEIWGALLNGGTLIGIDKNTALDADALDRTITEKRIDVLFLTTALFNALSKQKPDLYRNLQYCVFGAEVCDPGQVRQVLMEGNRPQHLLHAYGPCENSTYSTCYEVTSVLPDAVTIPIGPAIANSTAYVLDNALRPTPIGVPGEIYVGGLGLALGYLNRPELTKKVFIDSPFVEGQRLYKTGDLGRVMPGGNLEIMGRADDQVKIRGYRIELGEIETAINRISDVRQACVTVRTLDTGTKQLIAYCELQPQHQNQDRVQFKSRLKQHLPDYMVPAGLVFLEKLPLTPNGKVDKKALPEPGVDDFVSTDYVGARNEIEQVLVDIWQEVLSVERVGIYDDFFDLGGHSLLINKVAGRLKQNIGIELPLRTLFEVPTIAALSEILQSLSIDNNDDTLDSLDDDEFEEGSL